MKRILGSLMLLSIPLVLFLAAAQSGRYYAVTAEIRQLETAQSEWIEENRKLLSNMAVAGARSRVDESMAEAEGYRMVSPSTTLRILVRPGGENRDAGQGGGL
ncbi:MAG: hypothetical protein E4H20_10200 [Spirochaetales bacterium]|nr:MAG: hypothetical protein E4H20_10200 [Spirochaetales bacterium]